MYTSYYNLIEKPFKISTDPRFIWFGEQHMEAMANLKYGLEDQNGFTVLTGDAGTGKTTLVNALLDTLTEHVVVVKISHPSLEIDEFLFLFAKTLDPAVAIADKSDLLIFLTDYLQKAHTDGEMVLLIIDEAHRLSEDLLEEIRLLSNIEMAGKKLLSIILVGQNEIKPILMAPQSRSLRQRITSIYDIRPLSENQIRLYIEHRLKVSGTSGPLFTASAIRAVYAITGGTPRVINILCDRALLTGFVKDSIAIDADIILECGRELNLDTQVKSVKQRGIIDKSLPYWHALVQKITSSIVFTKEASAIISDCAKSGWQRCHAVLRSTHREFVRFIREIVRLINEKYQQKSLLAVMVMGVAIFSVLVTVGMYSKVKGQDVPSRGTIEQADTDRVATGPTRQEALRGDGPPKPTPLELAAVALEEDNHQRVIELLESYQASQAGDETKVAAMYTKALIGRSEEIMATSPAEAEALLLKAVDVVPEQADAHFMLGKNYTQNKEYLRAIVAYQRVVRIDPHATDAFFNLGFLYATTGRFEAAEKVFEQVVRLRPSYVDKTLFNLAVVQQNLGKNGASIANLEKVVSMAPENEKALAYLNRLKISSAADDAGFNR